MLERAAAFVSVTALDCPANAGRQAGTGRLASLIHHSRGGLAMKQNVRRIGLLSAALALVGALVLSSAVFARGPEGAGTAPNQPVSQQQVQAQNRDRCSSRSKRRTRYRCSSTSRCSNRLKRRIRSRCSSRFKPRTRYRCSSRLRRRTRRSSRTRRRQRQARAQNQLQVQSTAGPGQQHLCSDCDGSQAQEGKACQNGNIYGPGYGTGPIGCGLFGPGPYEKCLDQDGICDCREWKGGFR